VAAGGSRAFLIAVPWYEIVSHVLEFYLSIVPYNFDWVIVFCLDVIMFMYYV
jgi:hypothetical protein